MKIICPKCGEPFQIDESGYAAIVKQVHDAEFEKELSKKLAELEKEKQSAVQLAVLGVEANNKDKISELEMAIAKKEREIESLNAKIKLERSQAQNAVDKALLESRGRIVELEGKLKFVESDSEAKLATLEDKK
jgi:hypothetical protein